MKNKLFKGVIASGIAAGFAVASMSAQASIVSCGVYSIDTGASTSYACQSFGFGPNGTQTSDPASAVTSIITHNGASTLDSFGGNAYTDVSGLETWGGAGVGTFTGATLNTALNYLVLLFDTPLNGSQPWMVLSATGADLQNSISVTESSGTGTFKYRIYEGVNTPPNPVPLPGTIALLGLGLAAIGLRKKALA